jgi:hypothetical protein
MYSICIYISYICSPTDLLSLLFFFFNFLKNVLLKNISALNLLDTASKFLHCQLCVCKQAYIHTYINVYIHIYMYVCIYAYDFFLRIKFQVSS